ncbi:MAG: carboxypeptidase M32 [Anaerolineae bacterium]|jgi:carboxypeptidase Taq|nr:carboxypeptidase M32 [Anaerolineae bacterium]
MTRHYQALIDHLSQISNLSRTNSLLGWDMQVNMPPKGAAARGAQIETISRIHHELLVSDRTPQLIEAATAELGTLAYDSVEAGVLRVAQREYELATKFPVEFVTKWAAIEAMAHDVWAKARANNDFKSYQATLEQIMDLARQRAAYLGYQTHPYDALLDEYEQGITSAHVGEIFSGHKDQLVELIAAISQHADRVDDRVLHQAYPIDRQREFGLAVTRALGYDYDRGRQDTSVHPFAISFSRDDVRITTRFNETWLNPALFGMLHEAGHAMYEQGSSAEFDHTPLAGGTSLGVHESQSRLWENIVGRSRGFWSWALPKLQALFPSQVGGVDLDTFYKAINKVQPSFIRVEADEATYNLHIMLRFELEMGLLDGSIRVADLPQEWNARFESYLGIVPPTDTVGVLQDVHWSAGLIGYFPTYALGNLLAVQYYNQAITAHPSIPEEITHGKFDTLLTWLNREIHQHGRKYTSEELTHRITGQGMDSAPYIRYLQHKYSEIYGL